MRKNIFISAFLFLLVIFSQNKRFGEAAGQTPNISSGAQSVFQSCLKPCQVPNLKEEVFCGTYEVYENRVARKGRKISLNIVLLPALTSNPTPDPLFPIAGGPGQSATAGAANDAQRFAQIRRQRDIVLVDQRGTGKSNPLDCDFRNPNEALRAFVIGDIPVGQVKQCRQKLEKTADLRFYTTPIAMDDLDEVRNWLGYEQINVYGGSYGTRAALVYLKRHPKQTRTVTLRAVSSTYEKNPLYNPRDSQLSLDRLFEDCAKDEGCANAFPDLSRNFQTVLEQLAQSPAKVSVKNPQNSQMFEIEITRELFAGTIRRLLYDSGSQRIIPSIIKSALNKDFSQTTAIFDLGCGTGILCDAYAAKGHHVTGVDPSPAMLEVARRKPAGKKIEWVESSAQNYQSNDLFDLIIMTGHAFQVLLDDTDILATFAVMRRHLKSTGCVVFESRNPSVDWENGWNYEMILEYQREIIRESRRFLTMENGRMIFELHYEFPDESLVSTSELRFSSRSDIEERLVASGLRVENLLGNWNCVPFDEVSSHEMIFLARASTP
jgi:pimeloyl-ACP methyl ester carboxylesterase